MGTFLIVLPDIFSFIIVIGLLVFSAYLDTKKNNRSFGSDWSAIEENSYLDYSDFCGQSIIQNETKEIFQKKIDKIYDLVVKQKCDDIKFIAKESGCSYNECIIKIDYLKHNDMISDEYFVDHICGYIKKCSSSDLKILKKYKPYLCKQKLQIPEIVVRLPHVQSENIPEETEIVKKEIKYLIEKDLVQGVILNEIDDTLIYYDANKNGKNLISKKCPNCGAMVELQKGGKARCEYCNSIITSSEPRIISKIEK